MNKQEFQQKIKDMRPPKFFTAISLGEAFDAGFEQARVNALLASDLLDEPEKPVVPQYVADFYESIKGDFEDKVYDLCVQFFDESELNSDVALWFGHSKNKPIETLVMMHKFGYEVEKEKLYTVELPIHNGPLGFHYVLRKNKEGEIVIGSFYNKNWRNYDYCQLTEAEIKKDNDWAWKYAKEV